MLTNQRKHLIDDELRSIAQEIVDQKWSIEEWAARESGDWFQTANYCGGFEAEGAHDGAFAFAKFPTTPNEFWLCFTYEDATGIANGAIDKVLAYDAV